MAETPNKKEREKKRELKRKEKQQKKDMRKQHSDGGGLESMMAYVDENGFIVDTPQDPKTKTEIKAKNIEIGVPKQEKEDFDPTITGVITFYESSKGYGFIKSDDGENFFMHNNNVSGEPAIGKRVSFEKERSAKGWAAVKVKVG